MRRTITVVSLLAFLVGVIGLNACTSVTTPLNDYEKKLRQTTKENRSFQLPNAQILTEAISSPGMEYFLEKTGLIDKIANRHLKETGIYMAVELAYYDYGQYVKKNMSESMLVSTILLEDMKPLLIEAIVRASKEVESEL